MTDIEIARQAKLDSIDDIAQRAGIHPEALIRQGSHMAKIDVSKLPGKQPGKLVLVTAINPTPAGEGKTTTSVGLADGLALIGKRVMLALREPSLGPVFGVKGGAAGGGYSQVLPMEEINLHFTGDLHAITSANNLLAALIDNHIQQGNELELDPRRIVWRRCLDMNDRQLRSLIDGLGGNKNGVPREDGFDITAASEIMAVLCLSDGIADLKQNIGRITVGYNTRGQLVTAGDLGAQGAMSALLKQALLPNLVQTLAHTPALVHGGPFANIAHGCNSIIATRTALGLADYTITEAGFGADLGAEKFLDIKCRKAGIAPDAVVIVASVRALKFHGGVAKNGLQGEDVAAVKRGMPNLIKHIQNMTTVYHLPVVVAINRFASDSDAEMQAIKDACQEIGVSAIVADIWGKGGQGARELAAAVAALCEQSSQMTLAYEDGDSYQSKIEQVATKVYGAGSVTLSAQAHAELGAIEAAGYARLPICIAKTQYSLSDDPGKKGRPEGFELTIRSARLSAGAGFVVVFAGDIIAMPGLPKDPAANHIDIDAEGNISGLF